MKYERDIRGIFLINNKIAFYISIILQCIFLFACATPGEIRDGGNIHMIDGVPFFAQEAYQCGPASLATVMNFWGIKVQPDEIAKEIFSESARGTLNIDMVSYPQRKGLLADQHIGTIEDLKKYIDAGYPAIVLVDYGFSLYQKNHFMVVKGYNERGVIVNSGIKRDKFIPEKDFMKTWEKTKFWTLVIKPSH